MKNKITELGRKLFGTSKSEDKENEPHNPNMFTAYIIPNEEVDNYHKNQHIFRSDPNILRASMPFVPSAEEALEIATTDIIKQNIADLDTHTIIVEVGVGLAWAEKE